MRRLGLERFGFDRLAGPGAEIVGRLVGDQGPLVGGDGHGHD